MKKQRIKKFIGIMGKCFEIVMIIGIFLLLFVLISNLLIIGKYKKKIVSHEDAGKNNPECILILGCGVWGDRPSPMLADRLDEGIALYNEGVAPKIIVSGDHGKEYYDEVNVMKNYLIKAGIPTEDIFMDHAGFSTYESMVRAKKVFNINRMVVVTQKYHLYRALYIGRHYGIDAVGVNSDPRSYQGKAMRNIREWLARDKDIFFCLFRINPTYLGETIDITGDGSVTND